MNKIILLLLVFCCGGACWNTNNHIVPVPQPVSPVVYIRPYVVEQKVVWVPFVETQTVYRPIVVNVEPYQPVYYWGPYYYGNINNQANGWIKYNY